MDQLVGIVAIVAMSTLVIPRLARDPSPRIRLLRIAAIWVVIFIATILAIRFFRPGG